MTTKLPFTLERYLEGGQGERILFVPPIINHSWILDMRREISVVQRFCERGFDVYMLRWDHKHNEEVGFYELLLSIRESLDKIGNASIFGYCTGGIIALLFASSYPERTNSLSLLATPVDFSARDIRILWGKYLDIKSFRQLFKNIPGEIVNAIGVGLLYYYLPRFLLHREFLYETISPESTVDYWRRLRWVVETPPIPGKAYEEFIQGCYKDNLLIKNKMKINSHVIDLMQVDAPVLNIMAEFDHIVPIGSVRHLGEVISSTRYDEIIFPSTHVGLSLSQGAHEDLWPRVTRWIRENHRGDRETFRTTA